MAMTLRALALSAVALGIVLLPAVRSPREPEPTDAEHRSARLGSLRGRLNVAWQYWTALAERDSGTALAANAPASARPRVILRGFAPGTRAPGVERAVDSIWRRLDQVDSSVRVAVVVHNEAPYAGIQQRWSSYYGASISRRGPGTECVVLVPGEANKDGAVALGRLRWERERLAQALSPCLMLARFGPPGPAVGAWLTATRFAAAGSMAWLDRPRGFVDGDQAPPWRTFRIEREPGRASRPSLLLSSEIPAAAASLLAPPYDLSGPGLRCLTGDAASCAAGVLATERAVAGTAAMPPDLTYRESMLLPVPGSTMLTPRLPGHWWLSDLIRDQGRDKFARFWRSDQPFETAFEAAFGEQLGTWTRRWAVRQWEGSRYERYRKQPLLLGTVIAPSWPLLALAWTAVALLLTAYAAHRRQVT